MEVARSEYYAVLWKDDKVTLHNDTELLKDIKLSIEYSNMSPNRGTRRSRGEPASNHSQSDYHCQQKVNKMKVKVQEQPVTPGVWTELPSELKSKSLLINEKTCLDFHEVKEKNGRGSDVETEK